MRARSCMCVCDSETRCGSVSLGILGMYLCVCTCVSVHACVHVQVSEYMRRLVIVSMYVDVGRLCIYMCADF